MPSQCTLACLGTTVPCHSPTWALAVRRVLLSPPFYKRSVSADLFSFPLWRRHKLVTCEAYSACRHNARSRVSALPVPLRPLTALAVRRVLLSPPSTQKIRSFGSIFVLAYFTGCLRVSLVFVYICILS